MSTVVVDALSNLDLNLFLSSGTDEHEYEKYLDMLLNPKTNELKMRSLNRSAFLDFVRLLLKPILYLPSFLLFHVIGTCDIDILKITYPLFLKENQLENKYRFIELLFIHGSTLLLSDPFLSDQTNRPLEWTEIQTKLFISFIELEKENNVNLSYLNKMNLRQVLYPVSIFQLAIMHTQYNPFLLQTILNPSFTFGGETALLHGSGLFELISLHMCENMSKLCTVHHHQMEWLRIFFHSLPEKICIANTEQYVRCILNFFMVGRNLSGKYYQNYKNLVSYFSVEMFEYCSRFEETSFFILSNVAKSRIGRECRRFMNELILPNKDKETEMIEWLSFFRIHMGRVRIQFSPFVNPSQQLKIIGDSIYIDSNLFHHGNVQVYDDEGVPFFT
jgi:hypothetical protein